MAGEQYSRQMDTNEVIGPDRFITLRISLTRILIYLPLPLFIYRLHSRPETFFSLRNSYLPCYFPLGASSANKNKVEQ